MTCWYHSTPSKLCDACMREQAKAAPAEPSAPAWADMGDAAEVHGSAAIDFAMLDFSGDAKWEQRAVEFTAEKQAEKLAAVEALCGFAARMADGERTTGAPWVDGHSGHSIDAMRHANPADESLYFKTVYDSGPAPEAKCGPVAVVTDIDTERGTITFSSGEALRDLGGMAAASFEPGMEVEVAGVRFIPDPRLKQEQAYLVAPPACGCAFCRASRGSYVGFDLGYGDMGALEREVSDATDALRYALDNPGPNAKPFHQVMADWAPSGLAKDALFFGVDRSKYAKELRGKWVDEAPAPASHVRVGDRVLHRLDKRSGVMTVRSVVGRIAECVQLDGNVVAYDTTYGALQIVERGELR
jgi:hypothetical protein